MTDGSEQKGTDDTLRQLVDERDITAVLLRYAAALDQKDWELLSECFLPDATAEYETIGLLEGYSAIEAVCQRALAAMSVTQHLIGNIRIDVNGDSARSSCYLHAQHVRPGTPGGESNIMAGQYTDELSRTEAGWRIRRRMLSVWWSFGNPKIHEPLGPNS